MNKRYLLGIFLSIPLIPLLYFQGKRIKASVPVLPEAKNPEGMTATNFSKTIRLIAIGESTIAGVGVSTHREGFTGMLAEALAQQLQVNVSWKVFAKSGYNAKKVSEMILPTIQTQPADLIIVGTGGNDAFELNTPFSWKKQMQHLIQSIQSKFQNTPIAFTNMPPIKEFPVFTFSLKFVIGNLVEIFGEELKKVVEGQPQVFFNEEKIKFSEWANKLQLVDPVSTFFSDGVHPSQKTYQIWAQDFARYLQQNGIFHHSFSAQK